MWHEGKRLISKVWYDPEFGFMVPQSELLARGLEKADIGEPDCFGVNPKGGAFVRLYRDPRRAAVPLTKPGDNPALFDLDQSATSELICAVGNVLEEHLGVLPDMVLIVRKDREARTLFASTVTTVHPYEQLRRLLEQSLAMHNARHPKRSLTNDRTKPA
jgi:hypothetical protein